MIQHPYIKYAQALIMHKYHLKSLADITLKYILLEIEKGINTFYMFPSEIYEGKEKVKFAYKACKPNNNNKNITNKNAVKEKYVFLSPNIITSNKDKKYLCDAADKYIKTYSVSKEEQLTQRVDIQKSQIPVSGEFLIFSGKGGINKGYSKSTVLEQGLGLVTTLTKNKPCLQYISRTGKDISIENVCIIPNLSIQDMVNFIHVFERMNEQELPSDTMYGKVKKVEGKKKISYEPKRPQIYRGNFPNAPMSSALGSIALLGALGEFAKKTNSPLAMKVLNQLKDIPIYLIKYGNASIFNYNHYIVDLAKTGCLKTIINSMYYIYIYREGKREKGNIEYQKLDLYASRFLQSFTHPTFRDFMSIRAEYPNDLFVLFKTYFEKMEKIDPCVVISAKSLGQWLNLIAYKVSETERTITKDTEEKNATNEKEEKNVLKSKILIEFESTIFSAKSGDALIAQVMVRAGRLYNSDAPIDATRYIEETVSGNLPLDKAKNLLIAFMRLKAYKEKPKTLSQKNDGSENQNSNNGVDSVPSENSEMDDFLADE